MSKSVSVKWTKNTYEVALPPTLAAFKAELQTLTNVPIDRQKLVCKGKAVGDDGVYSALPDKSVLMLVGSAATIQLTQTVQTVNAEDSLVLPPGFDNLGNTCWLNSTLKALYHAVPELRTALIDFSNEHGSQKCQNHVCQHHTAQSINSGLPQPSVDEINLITSIGNLYKDLTTNLEKNQSGQDAEDTLQPVPVLVNISKVYPDLFDLAARDHEQQDVDEFLTYFITTLNKVLIRHDEVEKKNHFLIQELFGVDIEVVTEPVDVPKADKKDATDEKTDTMNDGEDEEAAAAAAKAQQQVITFDAWTKLRAEVNVDLTDIQGGIKAALAEMIEKNIVTAGVAVKAQFQRQNLIISLPKYLIVQLQRFQWKKETQSKAKLIRRVNINPSLDLFPFCASKTQKRIEPFRKTIDALRAETLKAASVTSTTTEAKMTDTPATAAATDADASKSDDEKAGYYDISAVITHQGRSADSGHYVSWTKTGAGSKYEQNALSGMTEKEKEKWKDLQSSKAWIKHDDSKMSFTSDKILADLTGGGDFHMAYICIYKAQGK